MAKNIEREREGGGEREERQTDRQAGRRRQGDRQRVLSQSIIMHVPCCRLDVEPSVRRLVLGYTTSRSYDDVEGYHTYRTGVETTYIPNASSERSHSVSCRNKISLVASSIHGIHGFAAHILACLLTQRSSVLEVKLQVLWEVRPNLHALCTSLFYISVSLSIQQ